MQGEEILSEGTLVWKEEDRAAPRRFYRLGEDGLRDGSGC